MSELAKIVAHYLEQIVRANRLTGFEEIRAEIEAADEADERRRVAQLKEALHDSDL